MSVAIGAVAGSTSSLVQSQDKEKEVDLSTPAAVQALQQRIPTLSPSDREPLKEKIRAQIMKKDKEDPLRQLLTTCLGLLDEAGKKNEEADRKAIESEAEASASRSVTRLIEVPFGTTKTETFITDNLRPLEEDRLFGDFFKRIVVQKELYRFRAPCYQKIYFANGTVYDVELFLKGKDLYGKMAGVEFRVKGKSGIVFFEYDGTIYLSVRESYNFDLEKVTAVAIKDPAQKEIPIKDLVKEDNRREAERKVAVARIHAEYTASSVALQNQLVQHQPTQMIRKWEDLTVLERESIYAMLSPPSLAAHFPERGEVQVRYHTFFCGKEVALTTYAMDGIDVSFQVMNVNGKDYPVLCIDGIPLKEGDGNFVRYEPDPCHLFFFKHKGAIYYLDKDDGDPAIHLYVCQNGQIKPKKIEEFCDENSPDQNAKASALYKPFARGEMDELMFYSTVRLPNGQALTFKFSGIVTAKQIKDELHKRWGIPVELQQLSINGRKWLDSRALADYTYQKSVQLSICNPWKAASTDATATAEADVKGAVAAAAAGALVVKPRLREEDQKAYVELINVNPAFKRFVEALPRKLVICKGNCYEVIGFNMTKKWICFRKIEGKDDPVIVVDGKEVVSLLPITRHWHPLFFEWEDKLYLYEKWPVEFDGTKKIRCLSNKGEVVDPDAFFAQFR